MKREKNKNTNTVGFIRTAKIVNIIISVAFLAFGIVLLAMPSVSVTAVGITVGVLLVVFGAFKLIGYFSKDLFRLAFQYDLQLGIALIVLGIILLAKPEPMMNFICIVFGISIFVDGIFKITIALQSRRFGIRPWLLILVESVITCAFGAVLAFCPSSGMEVLMILLGVSLIAESIMNLTVILGTVKIVKNIRRDLAECE